MNGAASQPLSLPKSRTPAATIPVRYASPKTVAPRATSATWGGPSPRFGGGPTAYGGRVGNGGGIQYCGRSGSAGAEAGGADGGGAAIAEGGPPSDATAPSAAAAPSDPTPPQRAAIRPACAKDGRMRHDVRF